MGGNGRLQREQVFACAPLICFYDTCWCLLFLFAAPAVAVSHWGGLGQHLKRQQQQQQKWEQQRCPKQLPGGKCGRELRGPHK